MPYGDLTLAYLTSSESPSQELTNASLLRSKPASTTFVLATRSSHTALSSGGARLRNALDSLEMHPCAAKA